jgi:hypothetical protein
MLPLFLAKVVFITWAGCERSLSQVVVVAGGNVEGRRLVESLEGFEAFGDTTGVKRPEEKGGGAKKVFTWKWKLREGKVDGYLYIGLMGLFIYILSAPPYLRFLGNRRGVTTLR